MRAAVHTSSRTSDIGISLLLVGLFALPLLINPVVTLSFDDVYLAPKVLWIYAVVLPSALLVIWRYWAALRRLRNLPFLLTAWSGWLILSTVLNRMGWPGWWGSQERADGVLMHLIYVALLLAGFVWARSDTGASRGFGRAVLLGGALLALTNVLQQVGLMGVPGEGAISGVWALPGGGTMGNRGYMGGVLALLLPVGLVALGQRSRWPLGWLAVVLIAWGWAGSLTRGAWLAGAVGLLWLLVWARPRPSLRSWGAVLLGIVLCVATAVIRGEGRTFTLSGEFNGTSQGIADNGGREVLWKSALYGISQRPLLGWGTPALWQAMNARPMHELLADTGQDNLVETEYLNPAPLETHRFVEMRWHGERQRAPNVRPANGPTTDNGQPDPARVRRLNSTPTAAPRFLVTHPNGKRELVVLSIGKVHNEYLDYALTYGLPAALLFVALLGAAIWTSRTLLPGLSAGLLAYAVYLLTWPEIIRFAPIAWFMMGIALVAYSRFRPPLAASPPHTPAPARIP